MCILSLHHCFNDGTEMFLILNCYEKHKSVVSTMANQYKIECTQQGNHTNNEREKIMVAIQHTLAHNKGTTNGYKIRDRMVEKGFSKIVIWIGHAAKNNTILSCTSCRVSSWKVNGDEYLIHTDVILK